MSKIFISYRRQDSGPQVARLTDALEKKFGKRSIFTDIDDIAPGDDFQRAIVVALKSCDVVLVVIGPQWTRMLQQRLKAGGEPDYVGSEIASALKLPTTLIPVLVGGATMPSARHLPRALRPLVRRNGVMLSEDNWNADTRKLCRFITASDWRVDPKRGYQGMKLVLPTVVLAGFWFTVITAIATLVIALFTPDMKGKLALNVTITIAIAMLLGLLSGAIIGALHATMLWRTRIVVKKTTWRRMISLWSILTVLSPVAALAVSKLSDNDLLPILTFFGSLIATDLGFVIFETKRIFRSDPTLGCLPRLLAAGSWMIPIGFIALVLAIALTSIAAAAAAGG